MKLSRRKFLQASAATGGVVLAGCAGRKPETSAMTEAQAKPKSPGQGEWKPSTCQGCTTWCPVEVLVQDGRVVKVRGNQRSKSNHGYVCPRGHLSIGQMYDPDRIKVPMKRTNPKKGRGVDPKFVPISWDEALETVAEKMMELRRAGEPEKFMLMRGRYTYCRDVLYDAVPKIFGSPNNISHSALCAEAEKFGAYYTEGYWDYRDYDLENTKYVLLFGGDPLASNRQVPNAIHQWGKVMDQATIAVVDPRFSASASKAHEWLPVIPGQDGALAVAMAHVILTQGLWSREFVGDFQDGQNRFKAGQSVDEGLFDEKLTNGVVKWWNLELKDRTPEWAAGLCGIPAEQIVRVASGLAKAAPNCMVWMAPGAAMQPRGAYAAFAAHALNGLVGSVDSEGGTLQKMKAPYEHIPLYGDKFKPYIDEIAAKGGKHKKIDQRGTLEFPALASGKSGGGVVTNRAADGILNADPYDIKVAVGYWNNFTFSCTGAERWEKAMEKIPFFVHITTNPAEMTQYADIVLPAAFHKFERWGFVPSKFNRYSYISLQQPVVKPLWDVRIDETEISWLLAEKLKEKGFPNLYDYFHNEMVDLETGQKPTNSQEFALFTVKYMTQNMWDPAKNKDGDKFSGWSEFLAAGLWQSSQYPFKMNWGKWKTETKKFEFYSETLKKALTEHAEKNKATVDGVMEAAQYVARGEQAFIPHYEPPKIHGDEKEFPFVFIDNKNRLNREARSANLPNFHEFTKVGPGDVSHQDALKINPADARILGLKDGDTVKVISPVAEMTVTVALWEGVRPGTVNKSYGQGHWAYGKVAAADYHAAKPRGGNNNEILVADYDRLSGSTARHAVTRVKIVKA
ncbi:molybdopterin-dependent oxidoreductase [Desulfuromonas versatilis]|uniref:molybdopterin-dependent oxidoreductase n=1 Tax=Desulfuromonas versatilis TaxID=2802975 RepID=UPI001C844753